MFDMGRTCECCLCVHVLEMSEFFANLIVLSEMILAEKLEN